MNNDTNEKVCETCDNAYIFFLLYLCTRKLKSVNQMRNRFVLVILSLVVCFVTSMAAGRRSSSPDGFVKNPMIWADVPDPDVIRVGDTYYLVSTTMHLMPGGPIMRSKDFKNWETVGYIFDKLTDAPRYDLEEGTVYGRGKWAT